MTSARKKGARIIAALSLAFSLCFAVSMDCIAAPPVLEMNTPAEGEAYGDRLAQEVWKIDERIAEVTAKENTRALPPAAMISIRHFGTHIPPAVEWAAIRLQRERERALRYGLQLFYEVKLVTPADLDVDLLKTHAASLREIQNETTQEATSTQKAAVAETEAVTSRSRSLVKELFGLSGGLTLWARVTKSSSQVRSGLKSALVQALWSAGPMAISLHQAAATGRPTDILGGTLALAGWVAVNAYWKTEINEVMTQGKRLTYKADGRVEITPAHIFGTLGNITRSLITNFVIVSSAFGLSEALTWPALGASLVNSTWNAFARGWVDRYISKKYQLGEWSRAKFGVVYDIWNTLYSTGKNLHLLGVGGVMSLSYRVLAVVGLAAAFVKDKVSVKLWWQRRITRTADPDKEGTLTEFRSRGNDCESVLGFVVSH